MTEPRIPFRELSRARQQRLRDRWADEMAKQGTTCDQSQKIARFDAWLAQYGVSFSEEDIPRKKKTLG
jgi:hypothetical protein